MNLRNEQLRGRKWILFSVAWLITVVGGLVFLFHYQTTAGETGHPATQLPFESGGDSATHTAHLVMAVHPHCPCTRASLESLARIMSGCQESAKARVLFVNPQGVPAKWEQTDLWHYAKAIPGVEVRCDQGGVEAARLGLKTSGHLLLFDRSGQRIFSGGVTAGRGHHGDNTGLDECLAILSGNPSDLAETSVFGCPLFTIPVCDVEGTRPCQ